MPLRHHLYPGNTIWTEEGYRFSWRVMLAEKNGITIFHIREVETNRRWSVLPKEHLTLQQEKQMSFQPDMILDYAHFLEEAHRGQFGTDIEVRAETYVALNGRSSRQLIDPTVDLTEQRNSLAAKSWIIR